MIKRASILKLLFIFFIFLKPFGSMAVVVPSPIKEAKIEIQKGNQKLSVKDIEKSLGRKLKFKERIAFWLLKKKLQKKENSKCTLLKLSFVFTFVAVISFVGLFFELIRIIPYVGLSFGLIGIILGIIGLSYMKNAKDQDRYIKRSVLAILVGFSITAIHFVLTLFLAFGRSQ